MSECMKKDTVTITEIALFVDMEVPYLKLALMFFAPELMEPYKEWDLEDESLNDKFIFPDDKETWKLIAFTINNAYIEDMREVKARTREIEEILGVD